MDDLARYNKERWEALAQAGIGYSRPWLDLTPESARWSVDWAGILGDVAGQDVLCLAASGGQQAAAFALLGARVTVLDLSETQIERDRQTAAHYGLSVQAFQGDMRDLSRFADDAFDIVWHAHSINFVPDPVQVFREVARVLRPGGCYRLSIHNPYLMGLDVTDWDGRGYVLRRPYADGELTFDDPAWDVRQDDGTVARVPGPREFRHTMTTLINGLAGQGFVIIAWGDNEDGSGDPAATPGSWEHFLSVAPLFAGLWAVYRPEMFAGLRLPGRPAGK